MQTPEYAEYAGPGVKTPHYHFVGDMGKGNLSITDTVRLLDGSLNASSPPSALSLREDNSVCITGMACHLPGGITSPSGLWDFLSGKKTAQCAVPLDRYNVAGFFNKDGSRAGVMNVDGGYFLDEDVRKFDPSFFGINNLEASYMDPQQRKLLEVVYECFEDAGLSMEDVSGSNTAVFVGNFTVDYSVMQSRDTDYVHRLAATGGGTSIMSNRISHVFNLHGPSLTLDTACSSTIYALHQAVSAVQNGDCESAIVAGANLITSPEQHFGTAKGGFLSPTSACHTFDVSADGYARAEAVNAIYITRLASSIQKGQNIRAVIRGTAINANGRTPGITLPDAKMQETVIRKAYQNAGLSFTETDYVECHGTGTPVGDPIEVDGVAACFAGRDGEPLRIGSVKPNMGHSEAASGLTSIIKVVLAFEHGVIPPTYGVTQENPKLKLKERNMKILHDSEAWPRHLRRASVNSFGYGGANAHVILEALDSYFSGTPAGSPDAQSTNGDDAASDDKVFVLPFSASSGISLDARRQQVRDMLERTDAQAVSDLASVLSKRQTRMRRRDFVLASANSVSGPKVLDVSDAGDKAVSGASPFPLTFVFTGQGAQYPQMAKDLMEQDDGFRDTIHDLDQVLQALPTEHRPDWTLKQTILDPPATSQINHVTRSQPICTAVQIGLVNMLRSWGVSPSAVIGHSSGEIAASYGAGLLTSSQAILAAYFRGFAVDKLQSRGAMLASAVSGDAAKDLIQELDLKEVCVACFNSPEGVTFSGAVGDIDALEARLQKEAKLARKLETGGRAYHSHMMVEVGDLYESLVTPHLADKSHAPGESRVSMFSTVGHSAEALGMVDSSVDMSKYFRRNLEQPVQFSAALTTLIAKDNHHLVELGPHAALKGPIQQIRKSAKRDKDAVPYSTTLVRKENAYVNMKRLAGTLFSFGHNLNWTAVNSLPTIYDVSKLSLLSYPWDYSKPLPWHEPRASVEHRLRKHPRHELLGTQATSGNGIEWNWRNIICISQMPWLRDHKLGETQVVLPGAAYLAMAVEALSQVEDLKSRLQAGDRMSFEFENVNISAAFVVPDDSNADFDQTELHTVLSRRKISTANMSDLWYEFSISSWISGNTTLHCRGGICASSAAMESDDGCSLVSEQGLEAWGMSRWYTKSKEEGLNFGPAFQSLTCLHTDSSRISTESVAKALFEPPSLREVDMFYAVHPITIDACFQAAIMGGTAGNVSALRAYVPVFVSSCTIQLPAGGLASLGQTEGSIHSIMEKTGMSTRAVAFTLRLPDGTPVIDMPHLRMNAYTGRSPVEAETSIYLQRQPCLRVQWKPDVLNIQPGSKVAFGEYIASFASQQSCDLKDNDALVVMAACLDLLGHKNPRMSVLELGQDRQWTAKDCQFLLGKDTAFPRFKLWHDARIDEQGTISVDSPKACESYDAVVIPHHSVSGKVWGEASQDDVLSLVSEHGVILTRKTEDAVSSLNARGFVTVELPSDTLLAVRVPTAAALQGKEIVIVKPSEASPAIERLSKAIESFFKRDAGVSRLSTTTLRDVKASDFSEHTVCISLLEMERELLASMSGEDMDRFRTITNNVEQLLWLTGADMLSAPNPDLTLSSGLSRALMLEQPALRYTVLDVGADFASSTREHSICTNISLALTPRLATDDKEFIQKNGVLYVSRFAPDEQLNTLFRQRMCTDAFETVPLGQVGPSKLSIGQVGMTDTIHFQQTSDPETAPAPGFVDVDLRAVSLNAKDVYALNGRVETRKSTLAYDFSGVISAVGPDVQHLKVGDRVVGFFPNRFGTTERVRVESVHKMLPEEDFTVLPTLLTVYCTAIIAFRERARLRAGESVLIHSGTGAFGLAAIAIAKQIGAVVYATVGSKLKREYLVKEVGIPDENIFNSRDMSFKENVMAATGSRGVDVIVNSLVGDLMHASWSCIAPFGRFVEIGKRELIDAGNLSMHTFLKNATFTAFDLADFFYAEPHYQDFVFKCTAEVIDMYRAGTIKASPIKTFDIADIGKAYRYFGNKDRIGKVVVSMENPKSRVQISPPTYRAVFNPDKTYLLIGCLGGLGRSLSGWMMSRGARKFCFLGRSGCDKASAAELVSRLRSAGAHVTVIRGDVCSEQHVREAVAASAEAGPIGGVIQAAMGLSEALFTVMENKAWHTGIQPKWKGTWNLHNALEGHDRDLDFFLMTSSISGSCGTATESNYCSANGFLDSFASWRRSQGKPAVSIGLGMISEVGYLHENPEIEAMLLRKGIQPLNEDEFLQVLDYGIAIPGHDDPHTALNSNLGQGAAHILTGLESYGVRKLMAQGFEVNNGVMDEARTSILAASLLSERDAKEDENGTDAGQALPAAEWMSDVPANVVPQLMPEAGAPTLHDAVLRLTKRRFSNLILMQLDAVDERASLTSFGVDSMLAAEFRTWLFNTFKVDVPFLDIVNPQKTLHNLAEFVQVQLIAGAKKE